MKTDEQKKKAKKEREEKRNRDLYSDRKKVYEILCHPARRNRWVKGAEIISGCRHLDGRPWDKRHLALVAASFKGRLISHVHGYRLQEHTPKEMILDSYRKTAEVGKSTIDRANAIIAYFNAHVDGKIALPTLADERKKEPEPAKLPASGPPVQVDIFDPRTRT